MKTLSGKTALVTGASRGIGRAIAKRLADDGAFVIVNYASNAEAAKALIAEIEVDGGTAFAIQAKLGSASETEKLLTGFKAEVESRHGDAKLDILVNNAGTGHFGTLESTSESDFDALFTANTKVPFLVTKAFLKHMGEEARIINISSGASRRPGTQLGLYAMTKAAIDAMALAFAAELGPRGITVNTVAPGWTMTEGNAEARQNAETVRMVERQTALGRLGKAQEIAAVVAFLASADGGWVTGQYIEASGGYRLL